MLLHASESFVDFLIKLYGAVVTDDWDNIETFNDFPQANTNTINEILKLSYGKFFNDRVQINLTWLNKGFSINDELEDWYIGIPDNLYTLKILYLDSERSVEEFFNEDDYDERERMQKRNAVRIIAITPCSRGVFAVIIIILITWHPNKP